MQTSTNLKTLLTASLVLLIISCNNSNKDKDAKDKPADTAITTVPASSPPDIAVQTAAQKCYGNDGLKYATLITINYTVGAELNGKVSSEELGTGKKQVAKFTGTKEGEKLTIKFVGTPPSVGDASEWTQKTWTIDTKSGKEKLRLVFNAKNSETNKWAETDYEFALTDCK
ncbi:MAG: hypothetical protein ABI688_10595 [Bacteroidota bacterium]